MEIVTQFLPNFSEIFIILRTLFIVYYGWVFFVLGIIYMLWRSYYLEIEHQYIHEQEWVFLSIRVPRENTTSTLGVESLFAHMHALHVGKTFAEKYVEGQIQLWYSLEIVSFGGKISYLMRIPAKMKNVVESGIYSQYPLAEIEEVEDYMKNIEYDPEGETDVEIFGTEWGVTDDWAIPIKTYKDFEHPSAEDKIIDPLSPLFESFNKIEPHEFSGLQIIIQPLSDEEWKFRGENKVKELTGEELPHELSFIHTLLKPINFFSKFSYKESLLGNSHASHAQENAPKNNWLNMTEFEKERVNLVERKISKPGYKTKIRFLYMAPKSKFDLTKRSMFMGAFRSLGSVMTNKLKPDLKYTWTGVDYMFSKELEKPYLDWRLNRRKRLMFKGFKNREVLIGTPMFVLNIEEIATLYHFPLTVEGTTVLPTIERTASKKSQPPADLPVVDTYNL